MIVNEYHIVKFNNKWIEYRIKERNGHITMDVTNRCTTQKEAMRKLSLTKFIMGRARKELLKIAEAITKEKNGGD